MYQKFLSAGSAIVNSTKKSLIAITELKNKAKGYLDGVWGRVRSRLVLGVNKQLLGTQIDEFVTVITKNENLPKWIQNSFLDGIYLTVKTKNKIVLYRDFGGMAFMDGSFCTTIKNATREELALHYSFKNSMRFKSIIDVPSGVVLDIGKVGPYPPGSIGALKGGADQIILPLDYDHNWIRKIFDVETGKSYTVNEFKLKFPELVKVL